MRQQIVAFINGLYPRLTAQERQAYHQLSSDLSVKDNIGPGVPKGNPAQREMRRAIFLLWTAIGKQQGLGLVVAPRAGRAMTLQAAQLNAEFSNVMLKAATVAPGLGGQSVFDMLNLHPVRFLTEHKIMVLGTPTGGDRFSTAPNGNYQNVLNFQFQYDCGADRFLLGAVINPQFGAAYGFQTVSVPAVHWSQVPGAGAAPCNFNGLLGCELTGANFMLTTQFTGCAFCWTDHGGVVRATHTSPAGGGPGTYPGGGIALATRMTTHGFMANAGNTAVTVFGGGAGNAPVAAGNPFYPNAQVVAISWVSIIGVNKGGAGWRFYTQVVNGASNIAEARRIM